MLEGRDKKVGNRRAVQAAEEIRSGVQTLSLRSNKIGKQGARHLADALKTNGALQTLELIANSIGEQGARHLADALKTNGALQTLALIGNYIGEQGARHLADALKTNGALKTLKLHGNNIGVQGARHLADALEANGALQTLGLGSNSIGEQGARHLADALKTNGALQTLDLGSNNIGEQGARHLADALKTNGALQTLGLGGNSIGEQGARHLADALKMNGALQTLNLRSNSIGKQGARHLADALEANGALQTLGLWDNGIGDEGARYLADALKTNIALQSLDLRSNSIGEQGARHLADALKTNGALQTLGLRSNNIGVTLLAEIAGLLERDRAQRETGKPVISDRFFAALEAAQRSAPTLGATEALFARAASLQEFRIAFTVWSLMVTAWAVDVPPERLPAAVRSCLLRLVEGEKVSTYEDVGLLKIFMRKLLERDLMTEHECHVMDRKAENANTENANTKHCEWARELRAQVEQNAARIGTLEKNVTAIHGHISELQGTLKKQQHREAVLGVVSIALAFWGAGIIDVFSGILDFADISELGALILDAAGTNLTPSAAEVVIRAAWSEDQFMDSWAKRKLILEAVPVDPAVAGRAGAVPTAAVVEEAAPDATPPPAPAWAAAWPPSPRPTPVHPPARAPPGPAPFAPAFASPEAAAAPAAAPPTANQMGQEQQPRASPAAEGRTALPAPAPRGTKKRLFMALEWKREALKVVSVNGGAPLEEALAVASARFGLSLTEFVMECGNGRLATIDDLDDVEAGDVVYLR